MKRKIEIVEDLAHKNIYHSETRQNFEVQVFWFELEFVKYNFIHIWSKGRLYGRRAGGQFRFRFWVAELSFFLVGSREEQFQFRFRFRVGRRGGGDAAYSVFQFLWISSFQFHDKNTIKYQVSISLERQSTEQPYGGRGDDYARQTQTVPRWNVFRHSARKKDNAHPEPCAEVDEWDTKEQTCTVRMQLHWKLTILLSARDI